MALWWIAVVVHAAAYTSFVVRRGEASWFSSLLVSLLLGPLVWFLWLAQRAGSKRATARR